MHLPKNNCSLIKMCVLYICHFNLKIPCVCSEQISLYLTSALHCSVNAIFLLTIDISNIFKLLLIIFHTGFAGCMYSTIVLSRSSNLDLGTITDNRNVRLDGCPPIHTAADTCKKSLQDMIYDGVSNVTYDNGLLPYTGGWNYLQCSNN